MRLSRYDFGEFELDAASRELSRNGQRIAVPPKSFECIAYLIANRDRAVGRDELISAVWGRVEVSDTVVSQTLLRARKALNDTGERQALIRTVPRFGYRWIASLNEAAPAHTEADVVDSSSEAEPAEAGVPGATATSGFPGARRRVFFGLAAIVALVALLVHWTGFGAHPTASATAAHGVLVLPVRVVPGDPETAWVRLGAMDYVASRLRSSGLAVVPSEQTLHLSAQLVEKTPGDANAWRRFEEGSGAEWVVEPEARREANGWRVRFDVHGTGQSRAFEGRGSTPLIAAAAATDTWLRRLDRANEARVSMPSPLTERLEQVDAELFAGQLASARHLIEATPQRELPGFRLREGQLEFRAGHIDAASRVFQSLLARQPAVTEDVRAQALMGQGAVEIRRDDYVHAEQHYADALALLQKETGFDPVLLGNAFNGRGVARVQQGKMEEAVQDMGMARIAMQRSGDLVEAAVVGVNLGKVETQRGHYAQALEEFDRSIAVFRRFDVQDYLAAAWMEKAESHLVMVQPVEAAAAIQQAEALARHLEDPYLVSAIEASRARTMLANGRLREASSAIAALQENDSGQDGSEVQELLLRLYLARGAANEALARARRVPDAKATVPGSLALVAIQAALDAHDVVTARAWIAHAPDHLAENEARTSWELGKVIVAFAQGRVEEALRGAHGITARTERDGTPDDRVRAGVLETRLLLKQGRPEAAAGILGNLEPFAAADYRVASALFALYRSLGDAGMAATSLKQAQALRGERDAVEAVL